MKLSNSRLRRYFLLFLFSVVIFFSFSPAFAMPGNGNTTTVCLTDLSNPDNINHWIAGGISILSIFESEILFKLYPTLWAVLIVRKVLG